MRMVHSSVANIWRVCGNLYGTALKLSYLFLSLPVTLLPPLL